jgi:hypothetical protein
MAQVHLQKFIFILQLLDIHEYLMEKGISLAAGEKYLYHSMIKFFFLSFRTE